MDIKSAPAAIAGWMAARFAAALRPVYQPVLLAAGSDAAAEQLAELYLQAVEKGWAQAEKIAHGKAARVRGGLKQTEISGNVRSVGERFAKAAASMDPDGLAAELVSLFCVGVPHMDNLDNRRRVVTVWSALLAPCVVMRERAGQEITVERIATLAQEWVARGYTSEARMASVSRKTRFVAGHPARIYDLLADTAVVHKLDHHQLIRSVIEPVVLSVGQFVGANGYGSGAQRQGASA